MTSAKPAIVIVNPTKFDDLGEVRRTLAHAAASINQPEPVLVETSEDDPGFGQTRDALAAGAPLVCALGGDGTVRAVAQELVGTGVPLGLLPGGTGNLLARNVGAPIDDLAEAFVVAASGSDRVIDVGWLELDDEKHVFTVMAGLGFDAQIMEDAPEKVKAKVGWAAYVASAAKHLTDDGFDLDITIDGEEATHSEARTVIVGNCGELTGGMVLLPEAVIDDGVLDIAVLTPTSLRDWVGVAARVLAKRETDGPSIERRRGSGVVLTVDPAQQVEVDGDVLSEASEIRLTVQPAALTVRVP